MVEILKQDQYVPMPTEKQVAIIFAGVNGYLDDIPVEACRRFEKEFLQFMETSKGEILAEIREKKDISPELEEKLKKAIEEFKQGFVV